ncbi:MAG TPA: AAA family ATPase, partial [Candidatus Paceibacterota bacterium]
RRIKGSEITEEIEYEMQDMNFINELKAYEAKPKFILCDRSVIDPVVYALAEGDTDRADRLLARMRHWLQTYHQFILFDKEGIPYKQDEFRDEDYKYRDKVHDSFIDFFSSLNIPYVVAAGDSENRTDFIERLLAEK